MLASKHSFRLLSKENIIPANSDLKPEKKEFDTTIESDSKKRSFLKLAGVVGVGALATTLLPRKADALVFGSNPGPTSTGVKNASGVQINPATEDTLATIKNQTNLLTFDSGSNPANLKVNLAAISGTADVGIQNASNITINPATQETLASINAVTSQMQFTGGALLTSVGGTGNIVGLKDTTSTQVNPATDDSLVYLRRMVKLMESQANVDASNRQRVTVDAFGAVQTGTGAGGAGIPRVTVSSDSSITTTISTLNGWSDQMFQDPARNAYANGIRYNLVFS